MTLTQDDFFAQLVRYPTSPGFKAFGTSQQAARSMEDRAGTLRKKVYELLQGASLTADECAERLDESVLAVRPRLSELRALGLICDSGQRRLNRSGKSAVVWRHATISSGASLATERNNGDRAKSPAE